MSDVIQAVGPHKNRHGERCEVKHIDQGIAFGFDSDGDPAWWRCADGLWQGAGDNYRLHITGPWIDAPTFKPGDLVLVDCDDSPFHQHYGTVDGFDDDLLCTVVVRMSTAEVSRFSQAKLKPVTLPAPLPAGYRLKPRNVKPVKGVDRVILGERRYWASVERDNYTAEESEKIAGCPYFFAEPIPVPEPPTVDVGEGWRRIDGDPDCVIVKGDEFKSMLDGYWSAMNVSIGKTVAEYQKTVGSPRIIRRRVPKPFRISTNGPGVYERADGKEFEVDVTPERQFQTGLSSDFIWWNEKDAEAWRDDGTWHLKGSRELPALNLVRYLRPLPKPAVDPEVWLPTTDIRLSAEQRFERNGVSKWMPVTFQEGT